MVEVSLDNSMFVSETANFSEESYNRARYYDANLGRFLTEDPIGYQAGPNFYVYVGNDTANLIDPSGLLQVCCRKASIGNKMFWLSKEKKPCHCFIKLSDGTTLGGYNKPPGILQKKPNDGDDTHPKTPPTCSDVPGSECRVRQAFGDLPKYQPYGIFGDTSNSVPASILSNAGISFTFPSCAWGSGMLPLWPNGIGPFGGPR